MLGTFQFIFFKWTLEECVFCLVDLLSRVEEIAQPSQGTRVQFTAPTVGPLQPPVTPDSWDTTLSSGF